MANEKRIEEQIKDIACSTSLKSFQRNRYFYGKLLTVRDFEDEQAYMNGKRHLLNRTLHGYGIVCGFRDIGVKEQDGNLSLIFVDGGFAIDGCGREIVVPSGSIKKIEHPKEGNLYIQRKDCYTEMVAAASIASGCEEKCCPNRIMEDFEVYLTETDPEALTACNEIKKGSHLENCPKAETKDVFIGSLKKTSTGWVVNIEENKRIYIPNTKLLARRLECHISENGIDPSKDDDIRDKHVSNADAKRWNSAIYTINRRSPDDKGDFKIKAGENITITEGDHEISISATYAGGNYLEYPENGILTLEGNETVKIQHNFGRYPVVDVYEYIEQEGNIVGTKDDIYHMAEVTGKKVEDVKKEVGARSIHELAREVETPIRNDFTLTKNLTTLNEHLAPREHLTLSPIASLIAESRFSDIADDIVVLNRVRFLRKITGRTPNVEVRHLNKNTVLIHNIYKSKTLRLKIIFIA